jgi:hypothetical protein
MGTSKYESVVFRVEEIVLLSLVFSLFYFPSPYSGSTYGNYNDVVQCENTAASHNDPKSGPDQGFSYLLEPGKRITIKQKSNSFAATYTLRRGGVYPGEYQETCSLENLENSGEDALMESDYTNAGSVAVPVYYVIDGKAALDEGKFELEWTIDTPGTRTF